MIMQDEQIPKPKDFIKSLTQSEGYLIQTTEFNKLVVQKNEEQGQLLQFSNPIYYAIMIPNQRLFVSQRQMPITIFKRAEEGKLQVMGQLHDIKKNSENFLAPLEICYHQFGNALIGCGKGFLHRYDLNKIGHITDYSIVKKNLYLSAICQQSVVDSPLTLVGSFNKSIYLVDLQSNQIVNEIKIHIGGVTHLQFSPINQYKFFSGARVDDLVYEWDLRNPERFVKYYERRNLTNQRMTFDVSNKDSLVMGNDDGTAVFYNSNGQSKRIQVANEKVTIHSSCILGDRVYFAYGQRVFLEDDHVTSGVTQVDFDE